MLGKLERLARTLGHVPTDEEAADMVRMSRRGFFGATAALAASSFYQPATIYRDHFIWFPGWTQKDRVYLYAPAEMIEAFSGSFVNGKLDPTRLELAPFCPLTPETKHFAT